MQLVRLQLFVILLMFAGSAFAADSLSVAQNQALDTTKNTTLGDIDIFGQGAIGSIYVLWDNVDLTIEVKKSIQEKSFATDEFFMQNIDREQFEQERILRLFQDEKHQYFKLFPDALEDEEEDEEDQ
jgi:hypothetical protein